MYKQLRLQSGNWHVTCAAHKKVAGIVLQTMVVTGAHKGKLMTSRDPDPKTRLFNWCLLRKPRRFCCRSDSSRDWVSGIVEN